MKILKPDYIEPPDTPYWVGVIITCPKCHAKWILDEKDQGPHGLRQEGLHGEPKVTCPTVGCGERVVVPVISRNSFSQGLAGGPDGIGDR
jgi:hypothetical protein